jgi:hypothetical protein
VAAEVHFGERLRAFVQTLVSANQEKAIAAKGRSLDTE